ncbi:MAG TPA: tetratricopeptide repeat protein [Terriglobia bacterium]|nr:tetratricopeptide repeat protein [Terriglobia bacterium]
MSTRYKARERWIQSSILFLAAIFLAPSSLRAQFPGGGAAIPHPEGANGELRGVEKGTWHIFGKVTDFKGEPVRDASVRVDIGYGLRDVKTLTTDIQGGFRTEYTLDAVGVQGLLVSLLVEREGLRTAREFVNFNQGAKTWEIDVTMMPDAVGDNQLPVESLVAALAPGYRASLGKETDLGPVKKDLQRGASEFLDRRDAAKALPSLQRVVKRFPSCGDCRSLLGLALLDAGAWNSSARESVEAEKLAVSKGNKAQQAEGLLILAELENWRSEYNKAAGFLVQAKTLDPQNAFVLQELGRTLVLQKNWEAADDQLKQATAAGASKEALLLRTRALLELGDGPAAGEAMKAYMGGKNVKNFPAPVRALDAEVQTRLSLEGYSEVQSVVSEPLASLMAAVPELKGIEPAASQADLAAILQNTGQYVQRFFASFQNTASVENIREEQVAKDGKIKDSMDQKFQYLLLASPARSGLGLEEFRTDLHGARAAPVGLQSGFMLTSGFASASVLFHPAYQTGARFRYLGRQSVNGHACYVVAFAETPEKAQMIERFNTSDESVLVIFQGLAWIDTQNYRIIRLRTDLLKPQTKIRLERQTTEITYDAVQFKQVASALWLPSSVEVTVEWKGRTYRNMHRYSDFRLFNTATQEKIAPVKVPEQAPPTEQP